jgi:hopanoid biosynthesis associated RND transporter like protein HpnN
MATDLKSPSARFLFWLAHAIYYKRRWFLYPQFGLALICILFTIKKLEFHTSRNDLVGGEKEYHRIYLQFKDEFPVQDDLVVVAESESMEKNRQFVERLGAKLEAETNLFASVFYKGDLKMMGRKALFFLPEKDLEELRQTLDDFKPFLIQFTKATNLVRLFDLVNAQFRTASREDTPQNRALMRALPALERIITQASDGIMRPGTPPSPGLNSLFDGGREAEQQIYITFSNGRIYLVTAQAKTEEMNERAVDRMRELIAQTQLEVPGLNVGLTGEPVLEVDEMRQSQRDTMLASVVSLLLVALIFIYGYNETGRPLKATLCLLIGLAYTMGFTTLTVGHLNILTITFAPILIGLAIDFGVHLITRYEEELRRGRTELYALEKAIVNTGMGIFTGAFTTAGAFFAMAAADFKGIQEMGIICGGGLLVCLVPMMTMLPVLLLRGKQNVLDHELGPVLDRREAIESGRRARIENAWLRRPWIVIGVIGTISMVALIPIRKVRFDYNLLHMQSAGLSSVLFQDKLIQSSTRSVLFAAVVADNLTQATNLIASITNLPSVGGIETMATYLSEDQTQKLRLIGKIKQIAQQIEFPPVDTRPVDVAEFDRTLWSLEGLCAIASNDEEVKAKEPALYQEFQGLIRAIVEIRRRMLLGDRKIIGQKLAEFQEALFDDVRETFEAIQNQDNSDRLRAKDLPDALRNRFIGVHGKLLIQVYPKKDVWDRKAQEEFIRDLRKVDPQVTGTPIQLYEYTTLLKDSFQQAAWYSLIAIAILVFVHFRKFSCVALSLVPVAVGAIWMLGMMGAFNVPFNPANIMTLPLIIGIGVTNGIHILNRFAEEEHPSILARSTGKAVLVSALTAIAGFGSLMLAQHRGIRSLGFIMSIGIATCMIVGLTFVPAILNILSRRGWKIKKNPV